MSLRPPILLVLLTLLSSCSSLSHPPVCHLPDGRTVEVGASYSDGCNCCVCGPDGKPACQAAACGAQAPVCHATADCNGGGCEFFPGCESPQGFCANTPICPLLVLGYQAMSYADYCGCDGETFSITDDRQFPDRPYKHIGACP
jgi:hypothetical protein